MPNEGKLIFDLTTFFNNSKNLVASSLAWSFSKSSSFLFVFEPDCLVEDVAQVNVGEVDEEVVEKDAVEEDVVKVNVEDEETVEEVKVV